MPVWEGGERSRSESHGDCVFRLLRLVSVAAPEVLRIARLPLHPGAVGADRWRCCWCCWVEAQPPACCAPSYLRIPPHAPFTRSVLLWAESECNQRHAVRASSPHQPHCVDTRSVAVKENAGVRVEGTGSHPPLASVGSGRSSSVCSARCLNLPLCLSVAALAAAARPGNGQRVGEGLTGGAKRQTVSVRVTLPGTQRVRPRDLMPPLCNDGAGAMDG